MNKVFGKQSSVITANGAKVSLARVSSTHHCANDFPRVFWTFNGKGYNRATTHECDEFCVETLPHMLFVMPSKNGGIESAQFHCSDTESFGLESRQNGPDKSAFNGVGLQQNKCAI
jgi:hypothetical protein